MACPYSDLRKPQVLKTDREVFKAAIFLLMQLYCPASLKGVSSAGFLTWMHAVGSCFFQSLLTRVQVPKLGSAVTVSSSSHLLQHR